METAHEIIRRKMIGNELKSIVWIPGMQIGLQGVGSIRQYGLAVDVYIRFSVEKKPKKYSEMRKIFGVEPIWRGRGVL